MITRIHVLDDHYYCIHVLFLNKYKYELYTCYTGWVISMLCFLKHENYAYYASFPLYTIYVSCHYIYMSFHVIPMPYLQYLSTLLCLYVSIGSSTTSRVLITI